MINLELEIAIIILSLDEYSKMTIKEKHELAEFEGIELDDIFEYLKEKYIGLKVSYINEQIKNLYQFPLAVIGNPKILSTCPCCSYKTILEKGNYEICPICFWEDDGSNDESRYSQANHMTLQDAKDNFIIKGVCSEKFLKFVDTDRELKYYKDNS